MTVFIKKTSSEEELKKCLEIRYKVFVEGQKVPINEDLDEKDSQINHSLLLYNGHPTGVARVRYENDFTKIERVGVLDEYMDAGIPHKDMQLFFETI